MRAEQKTATGWTPAAASQSVMLGGGDSSKVSPNPSRIQVRWLARRFGLAEQRASLLAELALGGAA